MATTPRVLVVEDSKTQRLVLATGLRAEGFDVIEAEDGAAALRTTANQPADVAIVDLMMPGMSGFDLARRLRELRPGMRVFIASGYELSRAQLEHADCGIERFLQKPFAIGEVAGLVRRAMT